MMLFWGCLIAIMISIMCLKIVSPLAERLNLVDYPGGRKQHENSKPVIGGIAIFIGFAAAMLSLPISLKGYRPFAAGSLLLIFMGILDDMHELSARARMGAEIVAALLMATWGGIVLNNLGNLFFNGPVTLEWFAIPFTVFAVVGLINAVNMQDGSDGLAGFLSFIQLFLFFIVSLKANFFVNAWIILLLMSALLGFLVFNFPFAKTQSVRVFMGDAGSMFLGYTISWFAISLSQPPHQAIYPISILWILGLTIWDAARVILMRIIKRKSPIKPDRSHLHHKLQDRGFSDRHICFLMGSINLLLGLVGVLGFFYGVGSSLLLISYLLGFMLYCIFV